MPGPNKISMLHCANLTVRAGGDGPVLLHGVSVAFPPGKLHAVIGPSGCGKTTMMKAILGLIPAEGEAGFGDEPLAVTGLAGRVGFAPQFTTAIPQLTVAECLGYQLKLSVAGAGERERRLEAVLGTTGLAPHREKRVASLSGGQLRRLSLGLELTLDPQVLVCDEVTSGLDPTSEASILEMLGDLCRGEGKTAVCIIHNLAALDRFDSVTVVFKGHVVFQGSLPALLTHFGIPDALRLYATLEEQSPEHWLAIRPEPLRIPDTPQENPAKAPAEIPDAFSQAATLLSRRTLLFFRDHGYLALTLAISFGFPVIVVIFALKGLPEVPTISMDNITASMAQAELALKVQLDRANIASLSSGLILFQIILLTLMGANNGGREIAAERTLYEKERITGLRPGAYAFSKLLFTGTIGVFQGLWMAAFCKVICGFPGPWLEQCSTLAACALAMTWVCLGFSALLASPEKASLLSIYMVGFQLPLSGVVLALPPALVWVCRPFVNAYWSWSGYMRSMESTKIYDAYRQFAPDLFIVTTSVGLAALLIHAAVGIAMTTAGCLKRRPL